MILGHLSGAAGLLDGLFHPLTGLDHLLAFATVGVLATLLRHRLAWWALPTTFAAAMAVGGTAGMAGLTFGSAEVLIALSVVALGLTLVLGVRSLDPRPLVPTIAGIALLHGLAHGTELPGAAHPALFAVGFLFATAGLHLGGAGVGYALDRSREAQVGAGLLTAAVGLGLVAGVV